MGTHLLIEDNAGEERDTTSQREDETGAFEELQSEAELAGLLVGGQELLGTTEEEEDLLYVAHEFLEELPVYLVEQEDGFGNFMDTLDSLEGAKTGGSHAI